MNLKAAFDFPTLRRFFAVAEKSGLEAESGIQGWEPLKKATAFLERHQRSLPLVGFGIAVLLLLSRGLPLVTHAQFFIEDGPEFYGNAYNSGWGTLAKAYRGYFHLIARLIALVATLFPLQYGPVIVCLSAILIQAGVAAFFLSDRLSKQIPSVWMRVFVALLIVGYPNSDELYGNIAHSQWFLGLLAVGILYAAPAASLVGRVRDLAIMAAIAITGPFAPVLAVLAWFQVRGQGRYRLSLAVLLTLATALIPYAYKLSYRAGLGDKHGRFVFLIKMVASQVFLGPLEGLAALRNRAWDPFYNQPDTLECLAAIVILGYGLYRGPNLLRGAIILGGTTLLAAVMTSSWRLLAATGVGERYFFVLGLSLLAVLMLITVQGRWSVIRWGARAALAVCLVGVARSWVYAPPYSQFDFGPQIAGFSRLPHGAYLEVNTPIDRKSPVSWVTRLRKP